MSKGKRRSRILAVVCVVAVGLLLLLSTCFSAPGYRGPPSDHFDGRDFTNREPLPEHGLRDFLRWRWSRAGGLWEDHSPEVEQARPPERVSGDELVVTFVGHSSFLIQTAGINVLTDPIWSQRCSPVSWAGPERSVPPGIRFADLPPVDVVLVSHNHYDHLDLPTLRRLAETHSPRFLVPLGNAALLSREGIEDVAELDWWESAALSPDVRAACVPARHFSGRGLWDRNATLWAGFVLETPAGSIYFAGDTGPGAHFQEVRERYGPPRLALLPIGAYLPAWFMGPVHTSPFEAAEAHLTLGARTSVGIHFGTFELADDGPLEPIEELGRALVELGIAPEHFQALDVGASVSIP